MGVPAEHIMAGGNSSLTLMYQLMTTAFSLVLRVLIPLGKKKAR